MQGLAYSVMFQPVRPASSSGPGACRAAELAGGGFARRVRRLDGLNMVLVPRDRGAADPGKMKTQQGVRRAASILLRWVAFPPDHQANLLAGGRESLDNSRTGLPKCLSGVPAIHRA